jgi:hypothetical protein
MDSGGFTELSLYGRWQTSPEDYVSEVRRIVALTGMPSFIAPQDWMCEEVILAKTGKTVSEHQDLTVANFLELRRLAPELPFAPVLQGFTHWDYLECAERYVHAGVDIEKEPVLGVGTMCRRQGTLEAEVIMRSLAGLGLRVHAFGAKTTGLRRYAPVLTSSDSLAWSFNARRHPPLPGCTHKNCNSCPKWALRWRERMLASLNTRNGSPSVGGSHEEDHEEDTITQAQDDDLHLPRT